MSYSTDIPSHDTTDYIDIEEEEYSDPVVITKYEYLAVVIARVNMLNAGHNPNLPDECIHGIFDNEVIAKLEIDNGVCPVNIKRYLPDGEVKEISLNQAHILAKY